MVRSSRSWWVRPDGFGVTFDTRNAKPNGMNVLGLANDAVALRRRSRGDVPAECACAGRAEPEIVLNSRAAKRGRCAVRLARGRRQGAGRCVGPRDGFRASKDSRAAFIAFAHGADLQGRSADKALPSLWLGALVHPRFPARAIAKE